LASVSATPGGMLQLAFSRRPILPLATTNGHSQFDWKWWSDWFLSKETIVQVKPDEGRGAGVKHLRD
jgi:hypothetical protein